jgi:hypothetical protein
MDSSRRSPSLSVVSGYGCGLVGSRDGLQWGKNRRSRAAIGRDPHNQNATPADPAERVEIGPKEWYTRLRGGGYNVLILLDLVAPSENPSLMAGACKLQQFS